MAKNVTITIVGDATSAQRALSQSAAAADSFSSKWESTAQKMTQVGSTLTKAVTLPIAALGFLAFRELAESGKVAAQTEAAIRSTGSAANVTAGQVANLSSALMTKSGIDDEAIASGSNLLLTFTRIRNEAGKGNDIFTQATEIALDLSVALGSDMNAASIMLGKALNDPIAGVTALGKAGVQLTDQQKAQIQSFVESGDVLSAQKLILKELETQVGGSAEAYGKTLAGQVSRAKESLMNAGATIIGVFAPALRSGASALQGFARWLDELGPGAKQAVGGTLLFAAAVGPVITVVGQLMKAGNSLADWFAAGASGAQTLALKVMYAVEALKAMSLSTVLVGGALAVGVGALAALWLAFQAGESQYDRIKEAAHRWADSQILGAKAAGDARAQIDALRGSQDVLKAKIAELVEVQERLSRGNDNTKTTAQQWSAAVEENNKQLLGLRTRHDELNPRIAELRRQVQEAAAAEKARKADLDAIAAGTLDVAAATDEAKQSIQQLQNAYLAAQGGAVGYQQSQLNVIEAEQALAEKRADGNATAEEVRAAELNVEQARIAASAAANQLTIDEAELANKLKNEGVGALVDMRNNLQATKDKYGDATGAVQEQIDKINWLIFTASQIPTHKGIEVDVITASAQEAINGVEEALNRVTSRTWNAVVKVAGGMFDD